MDFLYDDVCSGISAPTVAWAPLGWRARLYAEVAPFPSAVLKHHYPHVPNVGDIHHVRGSPGAARLLVGGTPCQSFSVAGLRGGMSDPRGALILQYLRVADEGRHRWLLWENVPGVLSSDGGRAFGALLGGLAELGYGFAWRVLDARHFGVPQRRRRLFLVGHLGDARRAGEVLLEPARGGGDSRARRAAREEDAGEIARCLTAHSQRLDASVETFVPAAFDLAQITHPENRSRVEPGAPAPSLSRTGQPHVAHLPPAALERLEPWRSLVRRLTPREQERLQGLPDDYTLVPVGRRGALAKDGPRCKALGNSMAVPVLRWIGERLARVDALQQERKPRSAA